MFSILEIVLGIIGLIIFVMTILSLINSHLPRWFCDALGWHLAPDEICFDSASFSGVCPRCGKPILQNSQGNWF